MAKYNVEFDYFHDYESEQFAFYRIPKVLFTDDYFRNLSSDAKVLYGLMLDRMALSIKNKWVDEDGRVYIIFTLEQVMQYMNCGKDKGVKIMAELDTDKGIGLIQRVKRGLGKPTIIYVKSFIIKEKSEKKQQPEYVESEDFGSRSPEVRKAEVKTSEKPKSEVLENRSPEVGKTEAQRSEKPKSGVLECRSTEVGKTDPNNTYYNNTDNSDNDMNNINLINPSGEVTEKQADRMDGMDVINAYTAIVKENIDYDVLIQGCRLGDTSLFQVLIDCARESGGALPIPVEVWMDEFANGSRPGNFENLITTLRSRNILLSNVSVKEIKDEIIQTIQNRSISVVKQQKICLTVSDIENIWPYTQSDIVSRQLFMNYLLDKVCLLLYLESSKESLYKDIAAIKKKFRNRYGVHQYLSIMHTPGSYEEYMKDMIVFQKKSKGLEKNRCFSQHYVLHSLTHNEGFENFFWTFEFFGLGSYRIDIWMDPNQRMQAVYLDWKNGEFHRFHQELFRHSRNRCQE